MVLEVYLLLAGVQICGFLESNILTTYLTLGFEFAEFMKILSGHLLKYVYIKV